MIIPLHIDPEAQRQIVQAARTYADAIVLQSLKEIGGVLSDTLSHWKIRNQARLIMRTKQIVEEIGIRPAKLAPAIFVPIMEEAANVDDENISEMFAQLLAAHLDEDGQENVHPSYAKMLGELAPLDVKIFKMLDEQEGAERNSIFRSKTTPESLHSELTQRGENIKIGSVYRSIENLERLALIQWGQGLFDDSGPKFIVTTFGGRFLKACNDSKTYWRFKLGKDAEKTYRPPPPMGPQGPQGPQGPTGSSDFQPSVAREHRRTTLSNDSEGQQ